ncbi:hypothetical protein [Candidatus Magnetobacterium casense]|uniref:hypothetical protein n=1 Tax=Candidatus Magnetobacterium casense TaxID=1455061 RepID=UPI000696941C|nr:hypothetical protein [Candidatus Magnetobacterium casensis]
MGKAVLGASPIYIPHDLFHIEKQVEHNGIEMGVLENGIPYLSENGLAKMCGVNRSVLNRLAINWPDEKSKERGMAINQMLEESGYFENNLYLKSDLNGTTVNVYTEPVCLAILEYYAFVSKEKKEEAINAFRTLARTTFRLFIYKATGYAPDQKILDGWKHFHDRVDMLSDSVPFGYFSIFREIASMIVPMIRSGVMISDKVVPDISVGKLWSSHWEENNMSNTHGKRIKYEHEYPLYYSQSKSNPQSAFAYPDSALGEFRAWLRQNYITNKFPDYIINQVKQKKIPAPVAAKVIEIFTNAQISNSK